MHHLGLLVKDILSDMYWIALGTEELGKGGHSRDRL